MSTFLIPVFILGALLLIFGALLLLSRFRGGRYLRPIMQFLVRVPLVGRGIRRMSEAALERSDPTLASAVKKLERMGANRDPLRAQQAMAQLSPAERKAILAATGDHPQGPKPANRAQRRQMERQRKRS